VPRRGEQAGGACESNHLDLHPSQQVSIEQLKAVHARTHPAESKEPDEKPGPDDAPETPET